MKSSFGLIFALCAKITAFSSNHHLHIGTPTPLDEKDGSSCFPFCSVYLHNPSTAVRRSPSLYTREASRDCTLARCRFRVRPPSLPSATRQAPSVTASPCAFSEFLCKDNPIKKRRVQPYSPFYPYLPTQNRANTCSTTASVARSPVSSSRALMAPSTLTETASGVSPTAMASSASCKQARQSAAH